MGRGSVEVLGKRGSCSVESKRERFRATCLPRQAAGRNACLPPACRAPGARQPGRWAGEGGRLQANADPDVVPLAGVVRGVNLRARWNQPYQHPLGTWQKRANQKL